MPFTSVFARNFVDNVPLMVDYLRLVEELHPELPRDDLPPMAVLLHAVRLLHLERLERLFLYADGVLRWAKRAFERAIEVEDTPHISIRPAMKRVSDRVYMDMSQLTTFELERYERDEPIGDTPIAIAFSEPGKYLALTEIHLLPTPPRTPYAHTPSRLLVNYRSALFVSHRPPRGTSFLLIGLSSSFAIRCSTTTVISASLFPVMENSYERTFVYRYDTYRTQLIQYLYHVERLYPELPTDELPPLGPLLHAMYTVHESRVRDLWAYANRALDWARLALTRAAELSGNPHVSIEPALNVIKWRVGLDVTRLVAQEVRRYRQDVELACDLTDEY
ncbi:hypothetical protein FS749_003660 [Ceratobasidium sp. UAMH 11750]|nr:hypothetical protein FS749_003660 [Ceratobasidium sp. UAMH 11750]